MATREQIDQLPAERVQGIREATCKTCEGNSLFDESNCRHVCPKFKLAVDKQSNS